MALAALFWAAGARVGVVRFDVDVRACATVSGGGGGAVDVGHCRAPLWLYLKVAMWCQSQSDPAARVMVQAMRPARVSVRDVRARVSDRVPWWMVMPSISRVTTGPRSAHQSMSMTDPPAAFPTQIGSGSEVGGSPRSRGAVAGGDQSVRASPGPHGLAVLALRVDVAGFEPACREGPRAAFPTIDTMSRPKAHLGPAREGGGRASTSEAEATARGLHDTHDDITVSDKLDSIKPRHADAPHPAGSSHARAARRGCRRWLRGSRTPTRQAQFPTRACPPDAGQDARHAPAHPPCAGCTRPRWGTARR